MKTKAGKFRITIITIIGIVLYFVYIVQLSFSYEFINLSASLILSIWKITGFIFIIAAIALMLYTQKVLQNIEKSNDLRISQISFTTKGPYCIIRFPFYTATFLALLGGSILFYSIIGIIIGAIFLYVYNLKIRKTELNLKTRYGIFYELYSSRTYRIVPYIW